MKKKFFLLIVSLLLCNSLISRIEIPEEGPLLEMPTPEKLAEIEQFLNTLTQEELDELSKVGQELVEIAQKEGRPLFGPDPIPAPKPIEKPKEEKKKDEPKNQPLKKDEKKDNTLTTKEKTALQKTLANLIESIASIRQKATSDEKILETIAPFTTQLNDLTYYLNVINYSKHLVHLKDTEFLPLKENLTKLSDQVSDIDDQLIVPELELSKKLTSFEQKERRIKLKKAEDVIKKFITIITSAIEEKHLLKDFERLLKKYEPEALKIKQDQEEKTKKAGEQIKKLPTTNTGQVPVSYSSRRAAGSGATQNYTGANKQSGYYGSGNNGGYDNYSSSSRPSSGLKGTQPNQTMSKKGIPADKKTENTKKEDDKKNKVNVLSDAEKAKTAAEDIKKNLKKVNSDIAQRKDRFHHFIDSYLPSAEPVIEGVSKEMADLFDQASFDLNKIKKEVTSWLNLVNKSTTNAKDYRDQTNKMKEFINNEIKDTTELHNKIKTQKETLPAGERKVLHKDHLDQLNKRFDDIMKELDKPL